MQNEFRVKKEKKSEKWAKMLQGAKWLQKYVYYSPKQTTEKGDPGYLFSTNCQFNHISGLSNMLLVKKYVTKFLSFYHPQDIVIC
jgi:hypothetical protein